MSQQWELPSTDHVRSGTHSAVDTIPNAGSKTVSELVAENKVLREEITLLKKMLDEQRDEFQRDLCRATRLVGKATKLVSAVAADLD